MGAVFKPFPSALRRPSPSFTPPPPRPRPGPLLPTSRRAPRSPISPYTRVAAPVAALALIAAWVIIAVALSRRGASGLAHHGANHANVDHGDGASREGRTRGVDGGHLCVAMDARSADPEDAFLHGLATVLQSLSAVYGKISVFVLASEESSNSAGRERVVDAAAVAAVLKMPSDVAHGSAPPIPPDLFDVAVVDADSAGVRVDASPPASTSYRAFLKLQAVAGGPRRPTASAAVSSQRSAAARPKACTAIQVAGGGSAATWTDAATWTGSPSIAHYAVAARRQTLAFGGVPIIAHFGAAAGIGRRADQRVDVAGVEDLEADFMEAAVVAGADAVVAESVSHAAEIASLPATNGVPAIFSQQRRVGSGVTVAPLPASPAAMRVGSERLEQTGTFGTAASECQGDAEWGQACDVATIAYWGPLDAANGLVEFCDAVSAMLAAVKPPAGDGSNWRGAWAEGSPPLRVEFIGREGVVSDTAVHGGRRRPIRAGAYIEARARAWASHAVDVALYTDMGHEGALRHLAAREEGGGVKVAVLSVMPASGETKTTDDERKRRRVVEIARVPSGARADARGENPTRSPSGPPPPSPPPGVVHRAREAVAAGVALVASEEVLLAAGVSVSDARRLSFAPAVGTGLTARLLAAVTSRGGARRAAMPHAAAGDRSARAEAEDVIERWIGLHHRVVAAGRREAARGTTKMTRRTPRVTACLVHRNRPALLQTAVDSLLAQDYERLDIVLVDNASDDAAAEEGLSQVEERMRGHGAAHTGLVLRSETRLTLAEARNYAASKAAGEYLLFMDDDNVAKPDEVRTLVTAALATGADISAPGDDYLVGSAAPKEGLTRPAGRWLPLGGAIAAGLYKDVYGDANALIRRSTFVKLGGWRVARGRGGVDSTGEDWELFARAVLRGHSLQAVPYPLFWYRQSPGGRMTQSTSAHLYRKRTLSPFAENVPAGATGALELAKTLLGARDEGRAAAAKVEANAALEAAARDQLLCGTVKASGDDDDRPGSNLVKNHDFSASASGVVADWDVFSDGYDWFQHGDAALAMTARTRERARGAQQLVHVGQTSETGPRPILLGARSRAELPEVEETPSADYSVYADLTHVDGSETFGYYVPFPGGKDWEWASGVIVPDKPVASVRLYCLFRHRVGKAWFDDVVLRPLTAVDVCGMGGRSAGDGVAFTRDTPFLTRN